MNDPGKNYETEYSIKDLEIVQGLVDSVMGQVYSLSGKSKMVSVNLKHLPFRDMIEAIHKSNSLEEFEVEVEPHCEMLYLAMLSPVFHDLMFKMIAHGIEEDDLRQDTMETILAGIATGRKNAEAED